MSTSIIAFPFDLFGSAGAAAGAERLADALKQMLADNRREKQPSRSRCYEGQVRIREFAFETQRDVNEWRKDARQAVRGVFNRKEFLIWLGGNHLSVLPVLEQLGKGAGAAIVQFDAHLDVYNLTDCTSELSHGNFLLHAGEPLPPIVHVGHRDLFMPAENLTQHFATIISASEIACSADSSISRLVEATAAADRLWIDIDCDVLDAAYFPAVDHSPPFGLSPAIILRMLEAIWSPRVAGVSISEFMPARDRDDQSLRLLLWLTEWMLLKRYET
jgi:arginase family enzyme